MVLRHSPASRALPSRARLASRSVRNGPYSSSSSPAAGACSGSMRTSSPPSCSTSRTHCSAAGLRKRRLALGASSFTSRDSSSSAPSSPPVSIHSTARTWRVSFDSLPERCSLAKCSSTRLRRLRLLPTYSSAPRFAAEQVHARSLGQVLGEIGRQVRRQARLVERRRDRGLQLLAAGRPTRTPRAAAAAPRHRRAPGAGPRRRVRSARSACPGCGGHARGTARATGVPCTAPAQRTSRRRDGTRCARSHSRSVRCARRTTAPRGDGAPRARRSSNDGASATISLLMPVKFSINGGMRWPGFTRLLHCSTTSPPSSSTMPTSMTRWCAAMPPVVSRSMQATGPRSAAAPSDTGGVAGRTTPYSSPEPSSVRIGAYSSGRRSRNTPQAWRCARTASRSNVAVSTASLPRSASATFAPVGSAMNDEP